MEFSEYLQIGVKSIKQHKLRSLLTTLGVIFGVAAVIAMMSIAGGAKKTALEQIKLLGTNNIRINYVRLTGEKAREAEDKYSKGLSYSDGLIIKSVLPTVKAVSPIRFVDQPVLYKNKEATGRVVAVNFDYDDVTNFHASSGRFISPLDVKEAKRVCVLGSAVRRELFGYRNPIGLHIRIGEYWFRVVGLMESKTVKSGKTTVIKIRDLNKDIYIPITTALKRFRNEEKPELVDQIAVKVASEDLVYPTASTIRRILNRTHHGIKDYEIIVPTELLKQAQKTQQIFNIVMGSIAAISLLVGGIGIMNIMLATVTERTREIGIRRAIGASKRDILIQFLNETVLISVSGGLIGILLGTLMAQVITMYAHWETVISVIAIIVAFGISVLIGIVFGIYPARQAAEMDPIQALRTE
ncbi:MAG: FtsX-like permease family protein [Calditrichaeota bacterium]|nr:MAG: FtsX-like permease family protein [Calditrichota bacterium]